jgi:hypothetical protein
MLCLGPKWEITFRGRDKNEPFRNCLGRKGPQDRIASLPLFSPEASAAILADVKVKMKDGVTGRGVSLPTDDVLVGDLPSASRLRVHAQ